ncbi:hypothetical protein BH11BAC7_BH11BAC7_17490 [soil metagenome]
MATKEEVSGFLMEFKQKMKIWDVLFRDDRGKNTQALAALEIRPIDRNKILEDLRAEEYCEGPMDEKLYGGSDMWVFGRMIKRQEVYIKITIGIRGSAVICISFHVAEHNLSYPLKTY